MTKFTNEFIAEQREILVEITAIPWALCTCGKCTQIHSVPMDVEVVDVMGHVKNCYDEGFPYSTRYHADAKYIEQACNNYPEALDHIEQQAKRIEELEIKQHIHWDANMMLTMADNFKGYIDLIIELQTKLKEMEARLDLHQTNRRLLNRNLGFAHDRIAELEQERRWIPVSESKPELDKNSNEDGTINVLVYIKNYKRILEATYYPKMAVWNMPYGWGDETDNITHWTIATPKPPQEEE